MNRYKLNWVAVAVALICLGLWGKAKIKNLSDSTGAPPLPSSVPERSLPLAQSVPGTITLTTEWSALVFVNWNEHIDWQLSSDEIAWDILVNESTVYHCAPGSRVDIKEKIQTLRWKTAYLIPEGPVKVSYRISKRT